MLSLSIRGQLGQAGGRSWASHLCTSLVLSLLLPAILLTLTSGFWSCYEVCARLGSLYPLGELVSTTWATLCTPGKTLGQKSTCALSLWPLSLPPTQYILSQPWILGRLCVYKLKVDVLLDLAFSSRLTHLSFHSDPETSSLYSVSDCSPPGLRTVSTLPILPLANLPHVC